MRSGGHPVMVRLGTDAERRAVFADLLISTLQRLPQAMPSRGDLRAGVVLTFVQ
jgi:hypothetical protein